MPIRTFYVKPAIPEPLLPLCDMAYNLWYSWNWEAVSLFIRLGGPLWDASYQNPVRLLGMVPQERYERMAADDSYVANVQRVYSDFQNYLCSRDLWFCKRHPGVSGVIAYFSMEFGLDEGLPVYSGGLGMLAGDHLKSASDLGMPLVGVGLLYREGYFRQYLNNDGWQQEEYPVNDWYTMPVTRMEQPDGMPIAVEVEMPDGVAMAQIWRVLVGRVSLYLLDTNIPDNQPQHREITNRLYGGDREMRIRQEILLGVGGLRALAAMGIKPAVCHMNEGHSAFLALERIRALMVEYGCDAATAQEIAWASTVFTTHTPVPAGNERFDPALVRRYLEPLGRAAGFDWDRLLAAGRENPLDRSEPFCMTVFALRMAAYANAVSRLHQRVSRRMWKKLWPAVPEEEIPIGSITNGVHPRGWLSHDLADLYARYLGPRFVTDPMDFSLFDRIENIPAVEIWRTHERRRERLVHFARARLRAYLAQRGAPPSEIEHADEVLDPRALTIGFARRFATYKRATLILRDPQRLASLLNHAERPVQIIFAGKAHPHDNPGKEMIRVIVHLTRDPRFRDRIVFLEDYDAAVARYLVQGCDLWLNTPRRPLEASGTSGMKAALNGVLNCSIRDGWWDEAYAPELGFAIGKGEEYADDAVQDQVESTALYDLLENEIVPLFYSRGRDGIPREWVRKMKTAMRELGRYFNTSRMVGEYTDRYYIPAARAFATLGADKAAGGRALAEWRHKIQDAWPRLAVEEVKPAALHDLKLQVGDSLAIQARVRLGAITPEDVCVEIYHGPLNSQGHIEKGERTAMVAGEIANGAVVFSGILRCRSSGRHGFAIRILPRHPLLAHPYDGRCFLWE